MCNSAVFVLLVSFIALCENERIPEKGTLSEFSFIPVDLLNSLGIS